MHKYGVLGAYMPEFARIQGLMQFDLFHIYTVDEHILFVIRNMRRFGLDEYRDKFPLCRQVLEQVPKQELLYFAGMFHDMAKGRRGDHSSLGSTDALAFCQRHHLSDYDSKLVAWLVQHHLLMSKTAQREDINDPEVINRFAREVGDTIHLNYLYLLTVADINGTNPALWNSWKDALIADLYNKTLTALRRGLENPINKGELIADTKARSLEIITGRKRSATGIETVWSYLSDDYFLQYSATEIAWHTRAITKCREERLPLILVREETERGATAVFIYMHDHDNIFSRISRTLDLLDLNVVDARVMNSNHGYTLDTFSVLEKSGATVKGRERKKEITGALKQNLLAPDKPIKRSERLRSRRLQHFSIPTRVDFSIDDKNKRNIMEVSARDQSGFLSAVGMALEYCGTRVQAAKIATYGERVEDLFYITDRNNQIITDDAKLKCLSDTITTSLNLN
jgi:[protein-PII] uridylyltransferase